MGMSIFSVKEDVASVRRSLHLAQQQLIVIIAPQKQDQAKNTTTMASRLNATEEPYGRMALNIALKGSVGLLAFIPAVIVCKGKGARAFVTGTGFGIGCGQALKENRIFLKHGEQVQPLPESVNSELLSVRNYVASWGNYVTSFGGGGGAAQ